MVVVEVVVLLFLVFLVFVFVGCSSFGVLLKMCAVSLFLLLPMLWFLPHFVDV